MDAYEGKRMNSPSLHKYLYCHGNPVNCIDPDGRKTVIVVTDPEDPAFGSKPAANRASARLQVAGWLVENKTPEQFAESTSQFEGIILSGHGDREMSVSITTEALKDKLRETSSRLEVGIALSCHGFDYISAFVPGSSFTTPNALILGYWGYSANTYSRSKRIGKDIDKWCANPTFTSISYGNLLQDGAGMVFFGGSEKLFKAFEITAQMNSTFTLGGFGGFGGF